MRVKGSGSTRRKTVAEKGRRLLSKMASLSISRYPSSSEEENEESKVAEAKGSFSAGYEHVDVASARKPGVIPKMWTAEEDALLRRAVKKHGAKNWRDIAQDVPNRNHLQCLQRWKKALRPGLVKGHWSKEEDEYLLELMKRPDCKGKNDGWNWAVIAEFIEGRNAKQCRERWNLNLDPFINRGPWTEEEDKRLMELYYEKGGRWSLIAKGLEGRTENSVKTRYHSIQRKQIRLRGWLKDEDDILIKAVLTYGRKFSLFTRLLPGRSRGQMKKRFGVLCEEQQLEKYVLDIEAKIENGHKPIPIHIMVKQVTDKRRKEQLNVNAEPEKFTQNQKLVKSEPQKLKEPEVSQNQVDNFAAYLAAELETAAQMSRTIQNQQIPYIPKPEYEAAIYDPQKNDAPISRNVRAESAHLLQELLISELNDTPIQPHPAEPAQNNFDPPSFYEVDSSTYPEKSASTTNEALKHSQNFIGKLLHSVNEVDHIYEQTEVNSPYVDEGYESPISAADSFADGEDSFGFSMDQDAPMIVNAFY